MGEQWLPKGARIRARWLAASGGSWSPSGFQDKYAIETVEITGIVRHLRGDDPIAPTVVRLYVEPDGDVPG